MDKVIVFLLGAAAIIGLALGIDWLFWKLWCWALPQLWESGPSGIVEPGYWLFVAVSTVLSYLLRGFAPA